MPDIRLPPAGPHMLAKLEHPARNKLLRMGRRWRKTTLALIAAITGHGPMIEARRRWRGVVDGANVWFVDQTFPYATSVWEGVKEMLDPATVWLSERDRRIEIVGGGSLTIKSAAKPKSLVGDWKGIDGIVLNEAAKYSPLAWQYVRPALSDREAWTIWPSTPDGCNYFKDLDDAAAPAADNDLLWAKWWEPSSANPFWNPNEIEQSRKDRMSERMIQQEYYAEFLLHGSARTYAAFDRAAHIVRRDFDPARPIDLCVSFRVAPAAWLVTQGDRPSNEGAVDEITVDEGSEVRDFVEEFAKRYPDHARGQNVRVYGDASPSALGKSTSLSDYELIRAALPRAEHFVRAKPAPDKDRTNVVNNVLRDIHGTVGGFVDPSCTRLIRDLESTRNDEQSFVIDRQPGIGQYAHAWSCKLLWLYPVLASRAPKGAEPKRSWPQSTPEARAAQAAVYRAKKSGRIVPPKQCEQCEQPRELEAAHVDYSRPLDVRWLCRPCHAAFDLASPKGGTIARR